MPVRIAWLVQANVRDPTLRDTIVGALTALREELWLLPVVPRSRELPPLPVGAEGHPIVCMGPSFVPRVVGSEWKPGIFFDADRFRWSACRQRWPEWMFSTDGEVTTAAGALAALEDGRPRFIRPDEDSKLFDGGVFDHPDAFRTALGDADMATAVVSGGVRPVDAEWRCFVVEGRVVDASEYRRAGSPSFYRGAPPRVLELAEAAAARWAPAPAWCLDIASSGDHFGIVEVNCINAARFYAADVQAVLAAVRDAMVGA